MVPTEGYKVEAPQGKVSELKVTGLTITYKKKTYSINYSKDNVATGTAGVIATDTTATK